MPLLYILQADDVLTIETTNILYTDAMLRQESNRTVIVVSSKELEFQYSARKSISKEATEIRVKTHSDDDDSVQYILILILVAIGIFVIIVVIYVIRCLISRNHNVQDQSRQAEIDKILLQSPEAPYNFRENKYMQADCPICLSPFEQGVLIRVLACSHLFHGSCIVAWLKAKEQALTCPICNIELKGDCATPTNFRQTPLDEHNADWA